MATCPAGHISTTDDYCDQCGAKIVAAAPEVPAAPEVATCPACGAAVDARFCESCGYDVEAGMPVVTLSLGADKAHWDRMVGSGEPAFPAHPPDQSFELSGDRATLGRIRANAPVDVDIALTGPDTDPAVSHYQCEFVRNPDTGTWSIHDSGSANGTWVNDADAPLAEGAAHVLAKGDRILFGAWTRLTVGFGAAAAPEPEAAIEPEAAAAAEAEAPAGPPPAAEAEPDVEAAPAGEPEPAAPGPEAAAEVEPAAAAQSEAGDPDPDPAAPAPPEPPESDPASASAPESA
jgi:FHA domain